MKDQFLHKKFIFNEKIDANFLFSLYEDDFLYIEEIFKTTLDQVSGLVQDIPGVFNGNDINNLKKIIHKIKPAFGFTGFLITERACKEFEDACAGVTQTKELSALYEPLWNLLLESMEIMQKEYNLLKEFNTQ